VFTASTQKRSKVLYSSSMVLAPYESLILPFGYPILLRSVGG
jgi:hypothetical protein